MTVENNSKNGVLQMNSLLVVFSYHHKNTEKIAKVFAEVLDAQIKTPQQTNPEELQQYDIVCFGAGIDSEKPYKPLLDLADKLPQVHSKNAFIFSTSGLTGEKKPPKTIQSCEKSSKLKATA